MVIPSITCLGTLYESIEYGMNYLCAKFGAFSEMWTTKSKLIDKNPD